jgi:hypothetical protein
MGIVTAATNKHQACIDSCNRCAQACYECFQACLNDIDAHARKNCISMLVECAKMCQMAVTMMAMSSKYSQEHCSVCAKICDSCANECRMFQDDHCTKCANECKACADQCRNMASM